MGKSKNSKHNVKNNIFKVAGCKSLKAKHKAKLVTADRLKQLNVKNKQKIVNVDEQLANLDAEVRQPPKKPETSANHNRNSNERTTVDRQEKIRKYNETEDNCQQALNKLCSMEINSSYHVVQYCVEARPQFECYCTCRASTLFPMKTENE